MNPRSWLFCPADRPDRLRKAADVADVVVADLEDAVHVDGKRAAREALIPMLREDPDRAGRIWVRVNNDEHDLADDLAALRDVPIAGIVVPKAESAVLREVSARTEVPLLALIETATGLWQARELATVERVRSLSLGEYDLADDLGVCAPEVDAEPLRWARSRIVAATAAEGLAPPPAPVSVELADLDAHRADTQRLLRFGFFGRMCIHPKQIGEVHEAMRPGPDEVEHAREIVLAAERAERDGLAVLVVNGRMIDAPVIRRARRTLELSTADQA
ncbi:CoA ester lyase [Saccharopolyspora gloriosae]|uniref:HpcH/HpaI aldolase/citrate lyase family protein n=1 Tax=Saccharopolyspora gloriosae TaxID=455344 RepID=UPI001FB73A13|nr:CoA ester lyase [Saccharopolyspora gloriosae]